MKKGKRKTDNKTNALSEKDKQRLDKLQNKFLADEDFESKDADSFSLFIAKNDPELSRRLTKVEEEDFIENFNLDEVRRDQLRWDFVYNEKLSFIRELIDKKFETFFKQLISLSPNKKELKLKKRDLIEIFYTLVFRLMEGNPYLINTLDIIANSTEKKEEAELTDIKSSIYQEVLKDAGVKNSKQIIDGIINETFVITDLVLSAFEESNEKFKEKIYILSKRNVLKKSDKTYLESVTILKLIIEGWSQYKAINITANEFKENDIGNLKTRFYSFCNTRDIDRNDIDSISMWLKSNEKDC